MAINPNTVNILNIDELNNASSIGNDDLIVIGQGIYARKSTVYQLYQKFGLEGIEDAIFELQQNESNVDLGSVLRYTEQPLQESEQLTARTNIGATDRRLEELASDLTEEERTKIRQKISAASWEDVGNIIDDTQASDDTTYSSNIIDQKLNLKLDVEDLNGLLENPTYDSDTHVFTMDVRGSGTFSIDFPIEALITNVDLDDDNNLVITFEDGSVTTIPLNALLVGVVKTVNGKNPNSQGVVTINIDDIPNLQDELDNKANTNGDNLTNIGTWQDNLNIVTTNTNQTGLSGNKATSGSLTLTDLSPSIVPSIRKEIIAPAGWNRELYGLYYTDGTQMGGFYAFGFINSISYLHLGIGNADNHSSALFKFGQNGLAIGLSGQEVPTHALYVNGSIQFAGLSTAGFVKTDGSGVLSIDTNDYALADDLGGKAEIDGSNTIGGAWKIERLTNNIVGTYVIPSVFSNEIIGIPSTNALGSTDGVVLMSGGAPLAIAENESPDWDGYIYRAGTPNSGYPANQQNGNYLIESKHRFRTHQHDTLDDLDAGVGKVILNPYNAIEHQYFDVNILETMDVLELHIQSPEIDELTGHIISRNNYGQRISVNVNTNTDVTFTNVQGVSFPNGGSSGVYKFVWDGVWMFDGYSPNEF